MQAQRRHVSAPRSRLWREGCTRNDATASDWRREQPAGASPWGHATANAYGHRRRGWRSDAGLRRRPVKRRGRYFVRVRGYPSGSRLQGDRKRVYEALTDAKQFNKVVMLSAAMQSGMAPAGKPVELSPEAGGAFSAFGGHITGRNVELAQRENCPGLARR